MSQAAHVITFTRTSAPTGFFEEMSGSAAERLDTVAMRLTGLAAILFYAKNAEQMPPLVSALLCGIEDVVRDCLAVCIVEEQRIRA